MVSSTGCMSLCTHGPVVVVYPEGRWFRKVDEEVADQTLDYIENDADLPRRVGEHPAARAAEPAPRRWKTGFADDPLRLDLHNTAS